MDTIRKNMLYLQAQKVWGDKAQIMMSIEEMTELTQALCHFLRNREQGSNVYEELADVSIMIEQLIIIFDADEEVRTYKDEKLNRLQKLLTEVRDE